MSSGVREQTPLGWLGIEVYAPSGRLRPLERTEPVIEAGEPTAEPLGAAVDPPAGVTPVADVPAGTPAQDRSDRVVVSVESPHRALADAIARWGRLDCRQEPGLPADGEAVWVHGRRWTLAEVAVDGAAKRRLWKELAVGPRRAGRS